MYEHYRKVLAVAALALLAFPLAINLTTPVSAGVFEDIAKGAGGALKTIGRGADDVANGIGRGAKEYSDHFTGKAYSRPLRAEQKPVAQRGSAAPSIPPGHHQATAKRTRKLRELGQ